MMSPDDDNVARLGGASLLPPDDPTIARPEVELVTLGDILADDEPPDYLVDQLIERNIIGQIFGAPKHGKSLVMIDWAARLALGWPILGRVTKRVPIVIVAGEGHQGLKRRFLAWQQLHGVTIPPNMICVTRAAVPLFDVTAAQSLHRVIAQASDGWGEPPGVTFVDTFARNHGGDENSATDTMRHVGHCDAYLREPFNSAVILIHHPGHSASDRGRGSSAIAGALDLDLRLEKTGGLITIHAERIKDGTDPGVLAYRIEEQELRARDVAYTSVAVSEIEPPAGGQDVAPQSLRAVECLRTLYAKFDERAAEHGGTGSVTRDDWRVALIDAGVIKGKTGASIRQSMYKIVQDTKAAGLIAEDRGFVYPLSALQRGKPGPTDAGPGFDGEIPF